MRHDCHTCGWQDTGTSSVSTNFIGDCVSKLQLQLDHDIVAWQVLYVAHTGDSGAVMACTSFDVHFPLRLTSDHKPNRPDEHARIHHAGGNIDERRDRVVSDPKPHNNRITLLNMSRCAFRLSWCACARDTKAAVSTSPAVQTSPQRGLFFPVQGKQQQSNDNAIS